MATIEITPTSLVVHVEGWDRILALKSEITIPLRHVAGVERDLAEASAIYHGIKLPGTSIPGVIVAGSYLKRGEWSFWDLDDPNHAIILRLHDEHYGKVVVGVDDPDAAVRAVEAAISSS